VTATRRALALAAVVAAVGSGAALADAPKPADSDRLRIVEGLAQRFPGHVEKGSRYGKYGLWAGIVVQTEWQLRNAPGPEPALGARDAAEAALARAHECDRPRAADAAAAPGRGPHEDDRA
jgi:hypothetical protein